MKQVQKNCNPAYKTKVVQVSNEGINLSQLIPETRCQSHIAL